MSVLSGELAWCREHCVTEHNSDVSCMWRIVVQHWLEVYFLEKMQFSCLSQFVDVSTLLNNISVSRTVSVCVHMHKQVSACVSARVSRCVWGSKVGEQREQKRLVLMTHLSLGTRWRGGETMYPCSVNYDPSLTLSISLLRLPPGQSWFNDERDHFDYS